MPAPESSPYDVPEILASRRRLIGGAAAIVGLAAYHRSSAQDATPAPVASPVAVTTDPLPYMFIQTSDQGSWTAMRGQPGAHVLTLSSVSPQTIVIRDQPTDAAGVIPTVTFFNSVRFSADRPLQGVVSVRSATGEDVLVVSLFRASYDPSIAELVYFATRLDQYDDQHGIQPLQTQTANFTLPEDFGATTLFITNAYCREDSVDACQFG